MEKEIKRRISIVEQFRRFNLEFEFVAGVDGHSLSQDALRRDYHPQKALRTQCRELVPSEIGCALSHLAVYRRMVRHCIPMALVLEDDVVLPDELPMVLSAIEHLSCLQRPSVVLLSPCTGDARKAVPLVAGYSVEPYRNGFFAHAYVVTLAGAHALVKVLYPVGDVADCWKRLARHRVVDLYTVQPFVVAQDQIKFGGSTGPELRAQKVAKQFPTRYKFKLRRSFWLFVDYIWSLYDRIFVPYAKHGEK
jgi:glycosyl transferase family 25